MKKFKILIMILMTLIFTLLLTIMIENVSFAADFSGKNSINSVFAANPESLLDRKTISLRFSDMKSSNQVYCLEYHQKMNSNDDLCEYKLLQYIEITGEDVYTKMWDTQNQRFAEHSGSTRMNAILGEILSGIYGAGYGPSDGAYTDAQRALYYYFPIWVDEVGTKGELGISKRWYDEGHELVNNEKGKEIYLQLYDKFYNQNKREYSYGTIRIYLLDNAKDSSWQRLMLVSVEGAPPEDPDPQEPDYDGYIVIKGNVWEDGNANIKSSTINGIHDASDTPITGVTVRLKGGNFQGTVETKTDNEGKYTLTVNYKGANTPYHLEQKYSEVHKALMNNGYIEFEYDGLVYTTVKVGNVNETVTSKARENESVRKNYDEKNTMQPKNDVEGKVTARTEFKFKDYKLSRNIDQVRCNKWCTGVSAGGDSVKYKYTNPAEDCSHLVEEGTTLTHSSSSNWNTVHLVKAGYDYEYYHKVPVYGDPLNPTIITGYTMGNRAAKTEERSSAYPSSEYYEVQVHDHSEDIYCTDVGKAHEISTYKITYVEYYNVDLGLFRREQPDIALTSDIQKVDVTMNKQKYTYIYGHRGNPSFDDKIFGTKVKFENKYTYTYRKPVNPADVGYVADGNKDGVLDILVTYKITLSNQSTTLPVKVYKLMNYYDSEYTITSNTVESTENKGKFKKSVVALNETVSINPGDTEETYITYKVSLNAIKQLLKQDPTLNNAFEIHTYSTQYGSTTLCAEQRSGSTAGRTGKAYAGRDNDSTPGNAPIYYESSLKRLSIKTESDYEDDTDIAPAFVLVLDTYKVMAGTVYEDTQTDDSKKNNERLGNGIKDSKEKGIANVKVELMLADDKGELKKDNKGNPIVATMYIIDRANGKANPVPAVTYTDDGGNFWFGKEGSVGAADTKGGVVVDNYIIRYTYGDDLTKDGTKVASTLNGTPINARNFKSTIVTDETIKGVLSGTKDTKEWHLKINKATNATTAVDDLKLREVLDKKSLKYDNFNDGENMTADSIPVSIQVEYTEKKQANVNVNGSIEGGFIHTWETFDFGIIERPEEELIMDKTITKLKITLANGQVLIEGDPRTEKLDYTKALGIKTAFKERNDTIPPRDKLVSIEMDSEYIQGATLEVWYAITVTNNSEKDYEYSISEPKYYYYGNKDGLELVQKSVELVVDYVDPELVVEVIDEESEEKYLRNENWKIIDAETLYEDGLISENTRNTLKEKEYIVLMNSVFGSKNIPTGASHTEQLYASKLLANKEEELSFENHAEIVQINGKVARTIDSIDKTDRKQITKTYKPGDYVPSVEREYNSSENKNIIIGVAHEREGLHEQDDDMVRITITPPTGIESNIIIYIITAAVALTIIAVGIYIIKKKVLLK